MDHHHQRHAHDGADWRDVPEKVETGLVVETRVDRVVHAEEGERVAVGRRACHRLEGKIAGSSRPVLDDELPPEAFREPLADETRHDVLPATRGQTNDQTYRSG